MTTETKNTLTPPATAQAVIIAEFHVDQSDMHTDYFNSTTSRRVFLAWSSHKRDLFPEMRKAAATFDGTAHLGPGRGEFFARVILTMDVTSNGSRYHKGEHSHWHSELYGDQAGWRSGRVFTTRAEAEAFVAAQPALEPIWFEETPVTFAWEVAGGEQRIEHREKYSMGSGFYLQAGSTYSGWRVRKIPLAWSSSRVDELEVPAPPVVSSSPEPAAAAESSTLATCDGATLTVNSERGSLWLKFDSRPAAEVLAELRAAGWRWSMRAASWYHQDTPENRAQAARYTSAAAA